MRKSMILAYGVMSYVVGMASLVYMAGWLINLVVPRSIDSPENGSMGATLAINSMLFLGFAVQHSVMARPKFKAWFTNYIPEAIERSTYILSSGVALLAVMWLWQPMGVEIWNVKNAVGQATLFVLYGIGWAILVGSTFPLNHFDLFGLRQVWNAFRGTERKQLTFATPGPYRMVRHPIYVGWIILAWATPAMTLAHLAFALATTAYILVAIRYEERDLIAFHGKAYTDYQARTPMLIPGFPAEPSERSPIQKHPQQG